MARAWSADAAAAGISLVAPDAADPKGWSLPLDGPARLEGLLDYLGSTRGLNTKHVFLFGHSAGGFFASAMHLYLAERVEASVVHEAAFDAAYDAVAASARPKMPILWLAGERDQYVPRAAVTAGHERLRALGFPSELQELAGQSHSYDPARVNQVALKFFFNTRSLGPPR